MGFYSDYVLPRLMDRMMSGEEFNRERRIALKDAHGEVLEIGLGTGLSLANYPSGVTQLTAVDVAAMLPKVVAERIAKAPFPVRFVQITAEKLPFPDASFDCVVSNLTLCTIPEPASALSEIRRVLKPAGIFLFMEHGRADSASLARWQDRLNGIQKAIGGGCNLNRRIDALIKSAGLDLTKLDRFEFAAMPRTHGQMYRGIATRPA
jgi:ubiquinone/menaquinone biosynthesis C-methylase UbiE